MSQCNVTVQSHYVFLLCVSGGCRPDRYVPLFGAATYDPAKERDAVPFEDQLRALQTVIEQGKVREGNSEKAGEGG